MMQPSILTTCSNIDALSVDLSVWYIPEIHEIQKERTFQPREPRGGVFPPQALHGQHALTPSDMAARYRRQCGGLSAAATPRANPRARALFHPSYSSSSSCAHTLRGYLPITWTPPHHAHCAPPPSRSAVWWSSRIYTRSSCSPSLHSPPYTLILFIFSLSFL